MNWRSLLWAAKERFSISLNELRTYSIAQLLFMVSPKPANRHYDSVDAALRARNSVRDKQAKRMQKELDLIEQAAKINGR